jgi:hypothetical protein
MSEISLFTAVKYNNYCKNAPATGWCTKQLEKWSFPLFGSKIEVIEFTGNKVARYLWKAPNSNILRVALRIVLFATIVFPLIVLFVRAIIRRNIEFKKIEAPKVTPKTKPDILSFRAIHSHKENQVEVGKPFSIALWHSWTTGHRPWKIAEIPSFIHHSDQYVKGNNQHSDPDICGGKNDHVFVFEPLESGRGDIVMRLPDLSGSDARTLEKRFTIVAQ